MSDSISTWLVGLGLVGLVVWGTWDSHFATAARIGVDNRNLTMAPEPHDCEFMTAPIGEKHCHYEQIVNKYFHARAKDGTLIYSVDGGKSWEPVNLALTEQEVRDWPTDPTIFSASVGWRKVQD